MNNVIGMMMGAFLFWRSIQKYKFNWIDVVFFALAAVLLFI